MQYLSDASALGWQGICQIDISLFLLRPCIFFSEKDLENRKSRPALNILAKDIIKSLGAGYIGKKKRQLSQD